MVLQRFLLLCKEATWLKFRLVLGEKKIENFDGFSHVAQVLNTSTHADRTVGFVKLLPAGESESVALKSAFELTIQKNATSLLQPEMRR